MQGLCSECGREGTVRKGLCDAHYFRLRRNGAVGSAGVAVKHPGALCTIEGCREPRDGRGLCAKHRARVRRHGDASRVRVPCAPGPLNVMWSGDQVGYSAMHGRVRRGLGSARLYLCQCGAPAREWSYRGGDPCEKIEDGLRYSTDLTYYAARCIPCHRALDALARRV